MRRYTVDYNSRPRLEPGTLFGVYENGTLIRTFKKDWK